MPTSPWHAQLIRMAEDGPARAAAEAAYIRSALDHIQGLEEQVPEITGARLTPDQLAVLTQFGQMAGRSSDLTTKLVRAFDLQWAYPVDLPAHVHRTDDKLTLHPRSPFAATPSQPAPPMAAVAPTPPDASPVAPPAVPTAPVPAPPTSVLFVPPQTDYTHTIAADPIPIAPADLVDFDADDSEPAEPAASGPSESSRGTDSAAVVRED